MDLDRLASADELRAIRNEREPIYGSFRANHENIGLAWAGLLRAAGWTPPPGALGGVAPDVVLLMCAAQKLVRAANVGAPFHPDNVNDGVNYLQMAGEVQADRSQNGHDRAQGGNGHALKAGV